MRPLKTTFIAILLALGSLVSTSATAATTTNLRFLGLTFAQARHHFHMNASECGKNSCWGTNISNRANGPGPEFFSVNATSTVIDSYYQRFPNGTNFYGALDQLRIGLPNGTTFGVRWLNASNGDKCEMVNASSKALARSMGKNNPRGQIGIELTSGITNHVVYNPNNVQLAFVTIGWNQHGLGC